MSFWISQAYEIRPARGEKLADGRRRLTRYIAWKQNSETQTQLSYTYGDADAFPGSAPTGWTGLLLAKIEADNSPANNGAGNDPVIQLTYETPGTVTQRDETRNNGALLLRTIVSFWTTPATPSGYTLVSTNTENVNGFAYKTYTFAKGDGEISRRTTRTQNGTVDDGSVGASRLDIDFLTAPSASEPTWASVSGYIKIGVTETERDGHMIWSGVFAKGVGTVLESTQTRSMGKLVVYRIVALGSAPSAPAPTIGGTVTLFDTEVRKDSGFIAYDYRWAEAEPDGRVGISTTARPDGSLVYVVTELGVAVDTPAYPGSGTGYLVDLDNNTNEGHYVNRATYIKPPPDVVLKRPATFNMPGTAVFQTSAGGHELILSPSKQRIIQADEEVSYSTSQLTTAHWQLLYGCYLNASYIRSGATQGESQQQAFSNYVSAGGTASGTSGDTYNGVVMDEYSATLEASSPTSRPTGSTVIAPPENELYLTAIDGTQVFRRTLLRHSF